MAKDFIHLEGLEFYAYHGVFPEEAKLGQRFLVNVHLGVDLKAAGESDEVKDTVHYGEVYETIQAVVLEERFALIEALASRIVQDIFKSQPLVESMQLEVIKPDPPIPGHYDQVAVELNRERADVLGEDKDA